MIDRLMIELSFEKDALIAFLEKEGLRFEDADEYYVIRENGNIVASGAIKDDIIKLLAVDGSLRENGYLPKIISYLKERLFNKGYVNSYIYTKPQYRSMFKSLGYVEFASTDKIVLLADSLDEYNEFIESVKSTGKYNACIVMNANPFTNGHRYLVEYAAERISNIIVFVVQENKSQYSFKDRFQMVEKGLEDIWVNVIPSGKFIVSDHTFPSYFLKEDSNIAGEHAKLDAEIFVGRIAKDLGLKQRYLGDEPIDGLTKKYNEALMKRAEGEMDIIIVPRKCVDGEIISASTVRKMILNGEDITRYVPKSTLEIIGGINGRY